MDEIMRNILNELAKKRREFVLEVKSKQRALFLHIGYIILFTKYDKQNFNHWIKEIRNFLMVQEQRPRLKPDNSFPNFGFYYKTHVVEPFMEADDKTVDNKQIYYILRGAKEDYPEKPSSIDPEKLTESDMKKLSAQTVSFLEECCKHLGEWTLTQSILENLIKDKFKDYIN